MIRLGRVDYINTFPLAWSLARHLGDGLAEEVVGVPTTLNALLRAGDVDVANVSSVEYARNHAEYVLLPSLCVGSDGAVESVQLVTDVPLPAVRSIAVTGQSASSVVLVRTLFETAEIRAEGDDADACLMIGDEALRSAFDDPRPHHDLGALWRERTGLPMVFAVWAARVGTPGLDQLDRALAGAVADAHEHSADVARAAASRYGYPAGYLARYFEKLRYRFGERERAGLARFFELAHAAGALDEVPSLRFVSDLESVS
ncbi:MAG: chorismate dehydratase [Gaiellaceae bacterium]|nr:chorismate dehydratase [Gaiellaceae bacterium]